MNTRKLHQTTVILAGVATGLLLFTHAATGHVDSPLLLQGCGSCHVGHGLSGEPMLGAVQEDMCYQCHGSTEKRNRMVAAGLLSTAAVLKDVEAEFQKAYRHPVVDGAGHSPREELPLLGGGTVGHAECVDCHNPHQRIRTGSTPMQKVSGYSLSGQQLQTSSHEYEICLKCHSDRGIRARGERSLVIDFAMDVRSQHPVSRPGSGVRVPSLLASAKSAATMRCSDCHRSDDADAPRGPHGSDHRYLLSGNYDTRVQTDESAFAFEFCYGCHDRSSILGNESFPLHRQHLVGDPVAGIPGTSCYTCHASHGSRDNPHLLEFNPQAVEPEDLTRRVEYREMGSRSGECYMKCHGYNHGPGRY